MGMGNGTASVGGSSVGPDTAGPLEALPESKVGILVS
jgi:hypothetical protein